MGRPRKEPGTRVRDIAPTGVRLPKPLRIALEVEAAAAHWSLNKEVLYRLTQSLEKTKHSHDPGPGLILTLRVSHQATALLDARAKENFRSLADEVRCIVAGALGLSWAQFDHDAQPAPLNAPGAAGDA